MRVTVDLDYPSRLKLLKAYYNMRQIGDVEINRSAGGKGFHLVAYQLPITFEQSIELRRLYGDDPIRIDFDERYHLKPKQVLYTVKDGVPIEPITEPDLLNAPWWPYTTAGGIKK